MLQGTAAVIGAAEKAINTTTNIMKSSVNQIKRHYNRLNRPDAKQSQGITLLHLYVLVLRSHAI